MTWYSASLIVSIETKAPDGPFAVFEKIVLIEASSIDEAKAKGLLHGREEEVEDPTLTVDGIPARSRFVGMRKMIQITDLNAADPEASKPVDGVEVSWSEYGLKTRDELEKLASGDNVEITYIV